MEWKTINYGQYVNGNVALWCNNDKKELSR